MKVTLAILFFSLLTSALPSPPHASPDQSPDRPPMSESPPIDIPPTILPVPSQTLTESPPPPNHLNTLHRRRGGGGGRGGASGIGGSGGSSGRGKERFRTASYEASECSKRGKKSWYNPFSWRFRDGCKWNKKYEWDSKDDGKALAEELTARRKEREEKEARMVFADGSTPVERRKKMEEMRDKKKKEMEQLKEKKKAGGEGGGEKPAGGEGVDKPAGGEGGGDKPAGSEEAKPPS